MRFKLLQGKKLEWAALVLFTAAYIIIAVFHEPWFDEAQAWQIAKCASLREILFELPHYEGHPPLWHLILAIPAKLGAPFEPGLKTVGCLISAASVFLILFRLPYPRPMRLLLPFSYFVFYQYGVIVRPYGLMLLVFLLLALTFPQKDHRPWRFVGLLLLLCLTGAYGIMMAGGVAICWVYELLREKGLRGLVAGVFRDRRTAALAALLIGALLIIWEIMPRADTLATSKVGTNPFPLCFLTAMLTFMGECTLTTSSWFSFDRGLLQEVPLDKPELAAFCMIGLLLWLLLLCLSSKRSLKYLIVPYLLFAAFASAVYFSVHHVGVVLLFLLFWLGILFQDEKRFELGRAAMEKLAKTEKDRRLLKNAALLMSAACLLIPVYWSVHASVLDIKVPYSYGRQGAAFLREHGLENALIFAAWADGGSAEENSGGNYSEGNTYYVSPPVLLNAYFDRNLSLNLNDGRDDQAYMLHKVADEETNEKAIAEWKKAGIPELVLGAPKGAGWVFDEVGMNDYTLVYIMSLNYVWKNDLYPIRFPVYARNDIMDKYGLAEWDDPRMKYWTEGLVITDEMREQFANGVPVEDIFKEYMDAMFGKENWP